MRGQDREHMRKGKERIGIEEEEHLRKSLQLSVHLCIYGIEIKVNILYLLVTLLF